MPNRTVAVKPPPTRREPYPAGHQPAPMRRRHVLERLAGAGAAGLSAGAVTGLAGCAERLPSVAPSDVGEPDPDGSAPDTPAVTGGRHVEPRVLRVRNDGHATRYLTVAIYRAGRSLTSSSRDLPPGDAMVFHRTADRSGRYRVVVEGRTVSAERDWPVDDRRGDLLVRVDGADVTARQDIRCGPDCAPFATDLAGEAWPAASADPLPAPATLFVTAPTEPRTATLTVDRVGATLLAGAVAPSPERRLVIDGLRAPGPLDVAIGDRDSGGSDGVDGVGSDTDADESTPTETDPTNTGEESGATHRWPAVARSELHVALGPDGPTFDCGDGNPTVVCRNYDGATHGLTLTVADGGERVARRRVTLAPREIVEVRAAPSSGRYRLRARTDVGTSVTTRWSVCPPHLGTMVTVGDGGTLAIDRGRNEPPESAW